VTSFAKVKKPRGIAINHQESSFYVTNESTVMRLSAEGFLSFHYPFFFCTCFHFDAGVRVLVGGKTRGNKDGTGTRATFGHISSIASDKKTGNVFVTDFTNHNIREITPLGTLTSSHHTTPQYDNIVDNIAV
jgi:DNA-binding beta-propeller fold protein YncE